MKLLKVFEYVYLMLFAFSFYIVATEWNADRQKSYIFIVFATVTLLMFFFRRFYRRRFEKQKQKNNLGE